MAAGNILCSLFGFILYIYLARTLMPEAFGYLSYAFTIIFFIYNFVDLGLPTYGAREVAKEKGRASVYVSEIISFRIILVSALSALIIIVAYLFYRTSPVAILLIESLLILLTLGVGMEWAYQGLEKMHIIFISLTVTSILQLTLIYTYVRGPKDLFKVPFLYSLAAFPAEIVFLRLLKFRLMLKVEDLKRMFSYLSSSIVIWSISLFAQVYNSMDVFLLGLLRPISEVGQFTIARRVIASGALLMIFLANALLPRLSSCFHSDKTQFKSATHKFLKLGALLVAFIFLPAVIFSKELIFVTVGGNYLAAVRPFQIMTMGLICVVFNLPYSTGLIACGLEKEVLKQSIASAALSIISNLVLIPKYGMIGASLSFVFAEALALVWIVSVYKKKVSIRIKI